MARSDENYQRVQFLPRLIKYAEENEIFINKVSHSLGVLGFGICCYTLGAKPDYIPYLYCLMYTVMSPLRWILYLHKKWHFFYLDFCYFANAIFLIMLLFYPRNEKLFMVCFSFAEGPLSWALIMWRCSLVFHSMDKILGVFIHLFPGLVFMTIRWWNSPDGVVPWPHIENNSVLWKWMFFVPLLLYCIWQLLYLLTVHVLCREMMLKDPDLNTSFRELSRRARKANSIGWYVSGVLGEDHRVLMFILMQAMFTVVTMASTLAIFLSYHLHIIFQVFKVSVTVWYGADYLLFQVMHAQKDLSKAEQEQT